MYDLHVLVETSVVEQAESRSYFPYPRDHVVELDVVAGDVVFVVDVVVDVGVVHYQGHEVAAHAVVAANYGVQRSFVNKPQTTLLNSDWQCTPS